MTKILYGKDVVEGIKHDIKNKLERLFDKNINPKVAIIRIGDREDDISYQKNIVKNCNSLGIKDELYNLDIDVSQETLLKLIYNLNNDKSINGILLFRPFPKHLNKEVINSAIDHKKDIDCMNWLNLYKIFEGSIDGFMPCTPEAVIEMLKYYDIPLEGSNVVVINRSMVVGKPLSMMLLSHNATVTICHSKTRNLKNITKNADVVVTAIGKSKFFDDNYFDKHSIIIDVSINVNEEGKLCGDVDFEKVLGKVKAITPVPRGIGSVTTNLLLKHIVEGAERQE